MQMICEHLKEAPEDSFFAPVLKAAVHGCRRTVA
jgi:hypothetical protein